ncbi:MAG: hypothetical protein ACOX8S_00580 [Christensenellales bacterium]
MLLLATHTRCPSLDNITAVVPEGLEMAVYLNDSPCAQLGGIRRQGGSGAGELLPFLFILRLLW